MPQKVLLVDDDPELLNVMAERMRLMGIEVSTAATPWKALEEIEKEDYDAIVLDLVMPGINGLDVLKTIKKTKSQIQVILLTGYATPEVAEEAKKIGALDLMEKPANLKYLCGKIGRGYEGNSLSGNPLCDPIEE